MRDLNDDFLSSLGGNGEDDFSFDGSFDDLLASLSASLDEPSPAVTSEPDALLPDLQVAAPSSVPAEEKATSTETSASSQESSAGSDAFPDDPFAFLSGLNLLSEAAKSEAKQKPQEKEKTANSASPEAPSPSDPARDRVQTETPPAKARGKKPEKKVADPSKKPVQEAPKKAERPASPVEPASQKKETRPVAKRAVDKPAPSPLAEEALPDSAKEQQKESWAPYEQELRKKNRQFAVAMVLYILIFALLSAGGVYYLNGYMQSYEKSRPVHYMDRLMASFTDEDWFALMMEHFNIPVSEFEDKKDIEAAYEAAIIDPNNEIRYRKKIGLYTEEHPVYAISSGSQDIMLFHLERDETRSAGHGYYYWKPGEIEVLTNGSGLNSATLEIEAPKGVTLLLNGKPVSENYVVDDKVPYTLSELEQRFEDQPYKNRYVIDNLYLNYELKIGDTELEPYDQSGNSYFYRVDENHTFSIKITAMSDMKVMVNGALLKAGDAVFQEEYPVLKKALEGLDRVEDYVSAIPQIYTWKYSGLVIEPKITATDSLGNEVQPIINEDGSYEFLYQSSEELEQAHSARALEYMNAYIKYAVDDGNKTDNNYKRVTGYVLKNSVLRNTLYSSWIGGMHYGGVLSYTVNDVGVKDFIGYGENCFSCTGYFNITQVTHHETKDINNVYTLVFVKSGGNWYAVAMLG